MSEKPRKCINQHVMGCGSYVNTNSGEIGRGGDLDTEQPMGCILKPVDQLRVRERKWNNGMLEMRTLKHAE